MIVRGWLGGVAVLSSLAVAVLLAGACSSKDETGIVGTGPDANAPGLDSGPASDASEAGLRGCEGACGTTSLVVEMGGNKRPIDRAQFGTQGDAGAFLGVEAHSGGKPECPTQSSPTPTYTFLVNSIPRGADGGAATKANGVKSSFFDFKGDIGPPLTKAIAVSISSLIEDTATPPAWSAFDITATFPEGTVTGHVYAEYCASLSN